MSKVKVITKVEKEPSSRIKKTTDKVYGFGVVEQDLVKEENLVTSPLGLLYPYTKNAIDRFKQNSFFFDESTDYNQVKNAGINWVREETEKAKGIDYFIKNKGYLLWFGSATKGSTVFFGNTDRFCQQVYSVDDPKLYELFPEYRNTDTGKFDFNRAFPDPYGFPWIRGNDKFKYKALAILIDGKWFVGISNYPNEVKLENSLVMGNTVVNTSGISPDINSDIDVNVGEYKDSQYDAYSLRERQPNEMPILESTPDTDVHDYSNSKRLQNDLKRLVSHSSEKDKKEFVNFFQGIAQAQKEFSCSYFSQPIFGKTLHLVISPSKHRTEAENLVMPLYPVDSIVVAVNVPPSVGWFESVIINESAKAEDSQNLDVVAPMYFSTTGNGVDSAYPLYFEGPYGIRMITDQFGSCLHFQETNGFYVKAIFVIDTEIDKVKEDKQERTFLNEFTLSPHAPFSYTTCNDLEAKSVFTKRLTKLSSAENDLFDYVFNTPAHKDKFTYQFIKPADKWLWNIDSEHNLFNEAIANTLNRDPELNQINFHLETNIKAIASKRKNIDFSEHWANIKKNN